MNVDDKLLVLAAKAAGMPLQLMLTEFGRHGSDLQRVATGGTRSMKMVMRYGWLTTLGSPSVRAGHRPTLIFARASFLD